MLGPVPVVVSWLLTAAFTAMGWPPLRRLCRLEARLSVRADETAELLFAVAMAAMVSPVGGPVPAAGWQAVLVLVLGWFSAAWWRGGRRVAHARHAVSAAAMLVMVSAMPHGGMAHGPWLMMGTSAGPGIGWWTPLCLVAAGGFVVDAVHSASTWRSGGSRAVCQAGMALGTAYLLVVTG